MDGRAWRKGDGQGTSSTDSEDKWSADHEGFTWATVYGLVDLVRVVLTEVSKTTLPVDCRPL